MLLSDNHTRISVDIDDIYHIIWCFELWYWVQDDD